MIHFFVEGPDDETFFKKMFATQEINFYQYAQKAPIKVNSFLKTLNSLNDNYLFFADADGTTIEDKKVKLLTKYPYLNESRIFIVQYEIESWYLAGADKSFCDKYRIKKYLTTTDSLTKEMFLDFISQSRETRLNIMILILSNFNCELAVSRNSSFAIFYNLNRDLYQ